MRTVLLIFAVALGLACSSSSLTTDAKPRADFQPTEESCPSGSEAAYAMVENFLTNPKGTEARQETGTSGVTADQIQLVEDQSVCEQLSENYSSGEYDGYNVTYYKVGNNYFATIILKQPDDQDIVRTGLSFIDIYSENLNFIKGYGG